MLETTFDIKNIESLINKCLNRLYQEDKILIDIGGMEQSITYRLALYIYEEMKSQSLLREFDIDVEYNKKKRDPKTTEKRNNGLRPDIIIHKRGTSTNLLVIEIKGWWSKINKEKDFNKLKELTQLNSEICYVFGLFLKISKFLETAERVYFFKGNIH